MPCGNPYSLKVELKQRPLAQTKGAISRAFGPAVEHEEVIWVIMWCDDYGGGGGRVIVARQSKTAQGEGQRRKRRGRKGEGCKRDQHDLASQ